MKRKRRKAKTLAEMDAEIGAHLVAFARAHPSTFDLGRFVKNFFDQLESSVSPMKYVVEEEESAMDLGDMVLIQLGRV